MNEATLHALAGYAYTTAEMVRAVSLSQADPTPERLAAADAALDAVELAQRVFRAALRAARAS